MQTFNPQLKGLMNDSGFGKAQPFLFGEDFGEKVKARLEATAALQKVVYQSNKGSSKQGFRGSYPRRSNWGRRGGNYGPDKSRKNSKTAPLGKTTDGQVNKMTRIPFSSITFVGINTCCNKFPLM